MLNELAQQIHQAAKDKGFWDKDRNTGELFILIVSELSKALEADRKSKYASLDKLSKMNIAGQEENYGGVFCMFVKDTFEDEIADAIIRLLDLCVAKDIDIDWHIKAKMRYNQTRPHKHGKAY